jgi:hypothetical protein
MFIVKYDNLGNVLWAKGVGGPSYEFVTNLAVDAFGNVTVVGNYFSLTCGFGAFTLNNSDTTGNSNDMFIAKYDEFGNVLWAKSAGGIGLDYANNITSDVFDNIYMIGTFTSSPISFDADTLFNTYPGVSDICVVKYSPAGNVFWAKSVGDTGYEEGISISTDNNYNVYLTGYFGSMNVSWPSSIIFGTDTLAITNGTGVYLAKLNAIAPSPCSASYTLQQNYSLQSAWYLINQCLGSDSLSADSLSYVWSWGDSLNSISTGAYPSFTYSSPGNYVICVTITDTITGCTSTYCDSSTYISRSSNQMIAVNVIPSNSQLITGSHSVIASFANKQNVEAISIYPNPANDVLIIGGIKDKQITITNILGKIVFTKNNCNALESIDLSAFAKGVYFLRVGNETTKFIKQ